MYCKKNVEILIQESNELINRFDELMKKYEDNRDVLVSLEKNVTNLNEEK